MKTLSVVCLMVLVSQGALANYEAPEIVYQVLSAESASEGQEGMNAVAVVIVNRSTEIEAELWDMYKYDYMEAVVTEYKQFSAYNDRKWLDQWLNRNYTPMVRQMAQKAIERALMMENRPSWTHYHTVEVLPYWAKGHRGERIGKHIFYKGIK